MALHFTLLQVRDVSFGQRSIFSDGAAGTASTWLGDSGTKTRMRTGCVSALGSKARLTGAPFRSVFIHSQLVARSSRDLRLQLRFRVSARVASVFWLWLWLWLWIRSSSPGLETWKMVASGTVRGVLGAQVEVYEGEPRWKNLFFKFVDRE